MSEPGTACIQWDSDGMRTVLHADPVIRISDLMVQNLNPHMFEDDGTLRLDTAGQYRYRYVRTEEGDDMELPLLAPLPMRPLRLVTSHIYERIEPGTSP